MHGPEIAIQLEFEKGQLVRTHLKDAPSFSCQISGESSSEHLALLQEFIDAYTLKKWGNLPKLSKLLSQQFEHLTPFQRKVLHAIQNVPPGNTLSYGALAEEIGRSKAARAVGSACHINPFPFFIPCHRIIASNGSLRGFAYDLILKQKLLSFESCK